MYETMIEDFLMEAQAAEAIAFEDMRGQYSPSLGKDDDFDIEEFYRDALSFGGESYAAA